MDDVFKRAIGGSEDAFIDLLSSYKNKIFRTALAYLKNEADALDASQEVVIKVYKNLRKIKNPDALSAWITRITINHCLSEIKKGKRVTPVAEVYDPVDGGPKRDHLQPLLMQEAIETLPRELQTLIFLKYYDGFTLEEIAEQTRKPLGTVKTQLHRALNKLRKVVDQHD